MRVISLTVVRVLSLTAILVLGFALMDPAQARDFTTADFDPADQSQAETYGLAAESLLNDLVVVANDPSGNELFSAVPLTMELVALMTQAEIHASGSSDPAVLDEIIARANKNKPRANSFAFIVDGDPAWVRRNVTMYYDTAGDNPQRVAMPVVPVEDIQITEGGGSLSGWAAMAEDPQQLQDFLLATKVVIVVGEGDDSVTPIELDCSFWRRYALFDLRADEDTGTQ